MSASGPSGPLVFIGFLVAQEPEFSLTPNLDFFTLNFLILTPTISKVPIEKYGKTPIFSGIQHFYSYFQNPSENSEEHVYTCIYIIKFRPEFLYKLIYESSYFNFL